MSSYAISPFRRVHLDQAVRMSQAEDWPHRLQDWEMLLGLSTGLVAQTGQDVVATTLRTDYGPDVSMMNMIIVRDAERGQGLARHLMQSVMEEEPQREFRLVATPLGLPLYQKLGFVADGEIIQHQGKVKMIDTPDSHACRVAAGMHEEIIALDAQHHFADRSQLLTWLIDHGDMAAIRDRAGRMTGYAGCRPFGHGYVVGPILAETADDAQTLISYFAAQHPGAFLRIDTDPALGLSPWLEGMGLKASGSGVKMRKNAKTTSRAVFGLCSQALG